MNNKMLNLTPEQALQNALAYADIKNNESICLPGCCADGLYHFIVYTLCLRYEFYVDAANGDVLGIDTEPLPDAEGFHSVSGRETLPSVA